MSRNGRHRKWWSRLSCLQWLTLHDFTDHPMLLIDSVAICFWTGEACWCVGRQVYCSLFSTLSSWLTHFILWPRNLAGKLLNEAGKPPRECIVVRAQAESDIGNARAVLVETSLVCYQDPQNYQDTYPVCQRLENSLNRAVCTACFARAS